MKTTLQAAIIILLCIAVFSCSKEGDNLSASGNKQTSIKAVPSAGEHNIGDFYEGGYIFYLDDTKQHGLAAAPENQNPDTNISWNKGVYAATGAKDSGIGSGMANTQKIVTVLGVSGSYAALLCVNYKGGGYTDWFLPSKTELLTLSNVQKYVPGLTGGNYWSSTETDARKAWIVHFHRSLLGSVNKSGLYHVRAVRKF